MPTATWDRLPQAKRDAILSAAEAEFGRAEFDRASMNEVARAAGVSKGSLFQYFTDKADLYAHLTRLAALRVRAAVEASLDAVGPADPLTTFDVMLEAWIRYFHAHPDDLHLTAAASMELNPNARAAVRGSINDHYLEVLGGVIDRCLAQGQLRPDVDRDALLAMLIILIGHVGLASHVVELDPVLGLHGASEREAVAQGRRLLRLIVGPWVTGAPGPVEQDPGTARDGLTPPQDREPDPSGSS